MMKRHDARLSCRGVFLLACCAGLGVASASAPDPNLSRLITSDVVPGGVVPRGEPTLICTQNPVTNCQNFEYPRVAGTSFASHGPTAIPPATTQRVADHFRTEAAGGTVTQVCWWGTYGVTTCGTEPDASVDHFFINFYNRVPGNDPVAGAGLPDTSVPVATFEQGVNMTVSRSHLCDSGLRSSTEFTATLTGGATFAGSTCYFVEVTNARTDAGNWFWSRAAPPSDNVSYSDTNSNGYGTTEQSVGDRAFCLGIDLNVFGTDLCLPPTSGPPDNDLCDAATAISGPGSFAFATFNATTTPTEGQGNPPCNSYIFDWITIDTAINKDVWYNWTASAPGFPAGTPMRVNLTTCGGTVDTKMAVYNSVACPPDSASLLACSDDMCEVPQASFAPAQLNFNAISGQHYLIQLGGSATGDAGNGAIVLSAGAARGACCVPNVGCVELTAAACTSQGGTYGGDLTDCGGVFTMSTGTTPMEDIGATGTVVTGLLDDNGTVVPIGFTLRYWNEEFSSVTIGVNGQIAFGSPVYYFANTFPLPRPALMPNGLVAAFWDDLLVQDGGGPGTGCGQVKTEVRGTAPNRRFIVQWDHVCHFSSLDDNHFQIIMHENGNIELRYATVGAVELPNGSIVGLESPDGTLAVGVADGVPQPPVGGTSVMFTFDSDAGHSCGPSCPCDWNTNGVLNSQDFFDFLACFFTPACDSDYNNDNLENSQDFFDFLGCFFSPPSGC